MVEVMSHVVQGDTDCPQYTAATRSPALLTFITVYCRNRSSKCSLNALYTFTNNQSFECCFLEILLTPRGAEDFFSVEFSATENFNLHGRTIHVNVFF